MAIIQSHFLFNKFLKTPKSQVGWAKSLYYRYFKLFYVWRAHRLIFDLSLWWARCTKLKPIICNLM